MEILLFLFSILYLFVNSYANAPLKNKLLLRVSNLGLFSCFSQKFKLHRMMFDVID